MKKSVRIAPPNSMFFVEDASGGRSPEIDERPTNIWSTASTIIVGCRVFIDGESEFTLSSSPADVPHVRPAFDSMLETPTGSVEVSTSHREILLRANVPDRLTRVRIWTDHPKFPTRILASLG